MISYALRPCSSHTVFFSPPVDWSIVTPPFCRQPCQPSPSGSLQNAYQRLLLSIGGFGVPDFALPTSWYAVSVGHGIRTCIFSANRLCWLPYTWADLHYWDVRSALDPVTDVQIETRAAAGLSSSFTDCVKRAEVRKKTSMHARRRMRPLA